MEWRQVESNDFMVPTGQDGLEVMPPLTEGWFQWRVRGFENDGLPAKYGCTSEKENPANLNSDTRVPPLKESKVPQDYLGEGSCGSSPCEGFWHDCRTRTCDELFNDLSDFEIQTSMQNMDDIFEDSFPMAQDLMHLENPYESIHIPDSTHSPWNWRISMLDDSDTLMNDVPMEEDVVIEDPNFESQHIIDPIPTPESFITDADEPMCMKATALQELENVMLQLNIKTRICIRDALYRLAKSSKEQLNVNLCQSGSFMDLPFPSYSEFYRGTSRQEASGSLEQKTNVIDRAIAALMFDRPDYRISEFTSS